MYKDSLIQLKKDTINQYVSWYILLRFRAFFLSINNNKKKLLTCRFFVRKRLFCTKNLHHYNRILTSKSLSIKGKLEKVEKVGSL